MTKIQTCVPSRVDKVNRVVNSNGFVLPNSENVGDMLRDGDKIIAILGPTEGGKVIKPQEYVEQPKSPRSPTSLRSPRPSIIYGIDPIDFIPPACQADPYVAPPRFRHDPQLRSPRNKVDCQAFDPIPNPEIANLRPYRWMQEARFEDDYVPKVDWESYKMYDSDSNNWVVAEISPNMREWILAKSHDTTVSEPKYVPSIKKFVGAKFYQACGSYISIFMRPFHSGEHIIPIQYNITKTDIKEFQRAAEKNYESVQIQVDHLAATKDSLLGLLNKGMSETDYINVMIPYDHQSWWDTIEGVEGKDNLIPELRGRNPIIIVDTNGLEKRHPFLKCVLKRFIHAHLSKKMSFLFYIIQNDDIKKFASDNCGPSVTALRDIDEFVENMTCGHMSTTHTLLLTLQKALDNTNCDAITLISGAVGCHDAVANGAFLYNLRLVQKLLKPESKVVDVISLDADDEGEAMLRNIADISKGRFAPKRFHGMLDEESLQDTWAGVREKLMKDNNMSVKGDHRFTIRGQIMICEVLMNQELQRTEFWKSEWTCACNLLKAPLDARMSIRAHTKFNVEVRAMKGCKVRMQSNMCSVRTGGGYLYQADNNDNMPEVVDSLPSPNRNPWWEEPVRSARPHRRKYAPPCTTGSIPNTSNAVGRDYEDIIEENNANFPSRRHLSAPPKSSFHPTAPNVARSGARSPRSGANTTNTANTTVGRKPMARPTSAPPSSSRITSGGCPYHGRTSASSTSVSSGGRPHTTASSAAAANLSFAEKKSSSPWASSLPTSSVRSSARSYTASSKLTSSSMPSSARSNTTNNSSSTAPHASSPPTSEVHSLHSTDRLMRPGTRAPRASSCSESSWMEDWLAMEEATSIGSDGTKPNNILSDNTPHSWASRFVAQKTKVKAQPQKGGGKGMKGHGNEELRARAPHEGGSAAPKRPPPSARRLKSAPPKQEGNTTSAQPPPTSAAGAQGKHISGFGYEESYAPEGMRGLKGLKDPSLGHGASPRPRVDINPRIFAKQPSPPLGVRGVKKMEQTMAPNRPKSGRNTPSMGGGDAGRRKQQQQQQQRQQKFVARPKSAMRVRFSPPNTLEEDTQDVAAQQPRAEENREDGDEGNKIHQAHEEMVQNLRREEEEELKKAELEEERVRPGGLEEEHQIREHEEKRGGTETEEQEDQKRREEEQRRREEEREQRLEEQGRIEEEIREEERREEAEREQAKRAEEEEKQRSEEGQEEQRQKTVELSAPTVDAQVLSAPTPTEEAPLDHDTPPPAMLESKDANEKAAAPKDDGETLPISTIDTLSTQ